MAGLTYAFNCRNCGGPNKKAYVFCPWCGIEVKEKIRQRGPENVDGLRYTIESFRNLLRPIIEMNSTAWVANRIGVDESHVRSVMKKSKRSISERVAEQWLIKLGIENALRDGTLVLIKPTKVPDPPEQIYVED